MASLRAIVPRASLTLHSKQLQHRLLAPSLRHASTKTPPPPKPRVLEKPERFNPPSHPARLRKKPRYTGPPLSENERQAQKVKTYPHMMPPEGSFMRWFLTSRALHLCITLGILVSLMLGTWLMNFLTTTPFTDLLPPNNMFLSHPFAFLGRYIEIYKMHVVHVSEETAERRRQNVEDVRRRAEYRAAHGQGSDEGVFGGWTAKGEKEVLGPGLREGWGDGEEDARGGAVVVGGGLDGAERVKVEKEEEAFVDFEGKRRPAVKKWFGIW